MMLARYLNAACGCTNFDIFNVDLVPDVVVRQIRAILEMRTSIGQMKH